jgi:glycosyltransferase involved in cell wall biosynthesis
VRILTDVDHIGPNSGAEVGTFQIVRELVRRGHDVDVAYLQPGSYEDAYRELCGTVVQVPILDMGLRPRPKTLWAMQSAIRAGAKLHPDVVYENRYYSVAWARGVAASSRCHVVSHVRGFNEPPRVTDKVLSRLANTFITLSDFISEELIARGARRERVHTVYPGIDPDQYPYGDVAERDAARVALGLPADSFTVLFLGRIDPKKGPEVLFEAVRLLNLPEDQLTVLVVGLPLTHSYEAELKRTAPPNCHWLGLQDDVVTPFHAADVVAMPTMCDEAFGRTIIEAMATGRPVVASRAGGTPEALTGEWAQYLFDRGDAAALADRLQSLVDWRTRDPQLGKRCRDHVVDNFPIGRMIDGIEALLLDATKGKR